MKGDFDFNLFSMGERIREKKKDKPCGLRQREFNRTERGKNNYYLLNIAK